MSFEFDLVLKSLNGVSRKLEGCLKFHWCFKEVLRVFIESFKGVLRKFKFCFEEVSGKFEGCLMVFQVILRRFHGYLTEV